MWYLRKHLFSACTVGVPGLTYDLLKTSEQTVQSMALSPSAW